MLIIKEDIKIIGIINEFLNNDDSDTSKKRKQFLRHDFKFLSRSIKQMKKAKEKYEKCNEIKDFKRRIQCRTNHGKSLKLAKQEYNVWMKNFNKRKREYMNRSD